MQDKRSGRGAGESVTEESGRERNDFNGTETYNIEADEGMQALQKMFADDAKRQRKESRYEYDLEPPALVKQVKRVILPVAAILTVLVMVGGICYYCGYHRELTSDQMRELAAERFRDFRSGDQDAGSGLYMPEGGFSPDSDTRMLSEFYSGNIGEDFYSSYENDGEFLRFCQETYPDALYPTNEWTVEEVLDFYRNSLETWGYYDSSFSYDQYYLCWTPDYKHCFAVEDGWYSNGKGATTGWLMIDGVRVTAIDEQTYSVEPDTLIAKYRAGEWDGDILRSEDFGTTVYLSGQTELHYRYQENFYSPEQDPQGLAYDGYKDPWWYDDKKAEQYGVTDYCEYTYDDCRNCWVDVECYPDLPDDFNLLQIVDTANRTEDALDVLLRDGRLQRYSRMELVDEWGLSELDYVDLDGDWMCYAYHPLEPDDEMYYRVGNQIFALKKGGEVSLVFDDICLKSGSRAYSYLRRDKIFVCQDGDLYRVALDEGKKYLLDTGVLEMEFDDIWAYKKEDGYYTLYRDYDLDSGYSSLYLGTESLDYYLQYREHLDKADW